MTDSKLRAAIVGAGPSGFYASGQLLAEGFAVDLIDKLPTPFGLVRFGVAPDHPKIKNVTRVFEKTAQNEDFRFFGGVELGRDITREELLERYDLVLYTIGTSSDNRLGIEGEDFEGSHPATTFVAWYNGHPEATTNEFDLSAERAVVIGNGNVAIDVARMLVLDEDEVQPTDTADHAIEAFKTHGVKEVIILGRRGPAQAAFTNPELLELGELKRADVIVDPEQMELDELSTNWLESDLAEPTNRRNVEIMKEYSQRTPEGKSHRVVLQYLRSPVAILGEDGKVTGIRVEVNEIVDDGNGNPKAVGTGVTEDIPCGLVFRSIGYRGEPVDTIPFEPKRGLVRNEGGRVTDEAGNPLPGEYVSGWVKRGPSGVIGTNKKDSADTVEKIVADRDSGALTAKEPVGDNAEWLKGKVPDLVEWDGWQKIDAHEVAAGEPQGRPRVKLVDIDEMKKIAAS
ncbi:MAG: NADP oxidoreductase [Solirubrobacterales bacterium]